MQRQRGSLVPIASALADLPGPVQAIREASPDTAVSSCGQYAAGAEASPLPRPGATHGGEGAPQHNRRGTCPAPRAEDSAAHRI